MIPGKKKRNKGISFTNILVLRKLKKIYRFQNNLHTIFIKSSNCFLMLNESIPHFFVSRK